MIFFLLFCFLLVSRIQQQLSVLAARQGKFGFWGMVKETGVDDEGLAEFYNNHFTFPLYRDEERVAYQALGNRKIGLTTWNPWRLWKGYNDMNQRLKEKNLEGNLVGEGLVQGGVFIFDAKGVLRYAYEEETGSPLKMADLQAAMDHVASGSSSSQGEL